MAHGHLSQRTSSQDSCSSVAELPSKRCPSCNTRLPLQAFYTAGRSKTGQTRLHSHCKSCKLQRETERRGARTARSELESSSSASLSSSPSQLPPSRGHLNRVPEHESGVKLCTSCQHTKPLDKFYTAGRHKGGSVRFHSHCKSCKLENEAAQRMQPRKGGQEAETSEPMTSLPMHLHPEQASGGQQGSLLQQLQAPRLPQPPMMGPMPGLLNPQQLQALMVFRQNPALFSNPVLQSQLAMLMWTQMQQQQAPMWPMHQPPPMLQPVTGQQPYSAAAQSASTHQPSCQGPIIPASASGCLSEECNSSGGSNDSGCIQAVSGSSPKADQSPPTDAHFGHRFADDSDSAVTWAGRNGRGADQTTCTQSRSPGQPEASGTQFCLHNSGHLSGRDVTSSQLPEQARWPSADTPTVAPTPTPTPFATARPRHTALRACGHQSTADAIQLARAASNAAQQSLAATAAITDQPLARKNSSSLLADLRQAERHWMLTTQTSQPAQPAKVAELKRSSRQAARAVDQSQRAMDTVHSSVLHQAEAAGTNESSLQPLRWGKRVHVNRVRGHRQVAKSADRFQGWTVSGGILKPVASRQAPATGGRAAAAQGRAFRVEPGLFKPAPPADPTAASVEPLLLAAPAAKVPEEIAAAFIPRHSRKKGKVQRSAFE